MMKRLSVTLIMLAFLSAPLAAQSTYVEFSYQSFRPFIHFQLNLSNSYSYYQDPYHSAYLKGYMDGVNDAYYNDYRFYDLVRDIDIYEAGYRDGYRDRDLIIRLRGIDWYYRNRFVYDDYHSPYYSVQIWLGGLSLAFLQVPERRLPHHWKRHAHPKFVKYRKWHKHRHWYNDRDYRHYVHIERDYEKRLNRWKKEAHRERTRYQKERGSNGYRTGRIERYSKVDKRQARQRVREQPKTQRQRSRSIQSSRRNRTIGNSKVNESPKRQIKIRSRSSSQVQRKRDVRNNRSKQIKRNSNRQRESVRSTNRDGRSSKRTVRKESNRNKSRGTVQKDKGGKRSKGRNTRKSRGNNGRGN